MDELLASVDNIKFEIERQIENQIGSLPLPFEKMDKSGAAVCEFNLMKTCQRGKLCPLRHTTGDQTVVCKHWLRGLCKKGDSCEFLHQYDMSKMPECFFYSKFNACTNKECTFLHIDPSSKKKDCPWYDRGFCRHGPNCRHKHTKRVMCPNYLVGFCPLGPDCRHVHPKQHNINPAEQQMANYQQQQHSMSNPTPNSQHQQIPTIQQQQQQQHHSDMSAMQELNQNIHPLSQQTHSIQSIGSQPPQFMSQGFMHQQQQMFSQDQPQNIGYPQTMARKPLNQVICYKCGLPGHYANRCSTKRNMAF